MKLAIVTGKIMLTLDRLTSNTIVSDVLKFSCCIIQTLHVNESKRKEKIY